MIVRYFYFVGVAIPPAKTHSPLVVDTNAVLAFAISFEFLQSVPWRDSKVVDRFRSVYHHQFPVSDALDVHRKAFAGQPLEDALRL